jgi:hypothetical protein
MLCGNFFNRVDPYPIWYKTNSYSNIATSNWNAKMQRSNQLAPCMFNECKGCFMYHEFIMANIRTSAHGISDIKFSSMNPKHFIIFVKSLRIYLKIPLKLSLKWYFRQCFHYFFWFVVMIFKPTIIFYTHNNNKSNNKHLQANNYLQ